MSRFVYLILICFTLASCASGPAVHKRSRLKSHRTAKENIVHQDRAGETRAGPSKWRKSLRNRRGPLVPTIIHPRDGSVMVLIKPGKTASRNPAYISTNVQEAAPSARFQSQRPFYIDLNEVTVEQFKRYNPKYDEKPYTGGKPCPQCPAMAIDWKHANRYCLWTGRRLPTEAEWETAAGGRGSRPWGDQINPRHANILGEEDGYLFAAPVRSFPAGASPSGALDMIGNVWEWVGDPYPVKSTKNSDGKGASILRIVKGGGWTSPAKIARISFRNVVDPNLKNPTFGFRCSKSFY